MFETILDPRRKTIRVKIPLTTPKGKARVKQRAKPSQFGKAFYTRQEPFNGHNYVEWQISYDISPEKSEEKTPKTYLAYNGNQKAFSELSQYLRYLVDWNVITKEELRDLSRLIKGMSVADLLDQHPHCRNIHMTPLGKDTINGMPFMKSNLHYPQLIYGFPNSDCTVEITIREQQYAASVQPMLYFCIPISELEGGASLIGRTAGVKERAEFVFGQDNASMIVDLVKLFGMLSERHRFDTIAILDVLEP